VAVAGVLATALTTHAAHPKSLLIDGVDVIGPIGGYGVPLDTISVTENGPGRTSSMSFTIDDPSRLVNLTDSASVAFMDNARDYPLFLGWVDRYEMQPAFGDQGRAIKVECVGIEAALDWAITANAITLPVSTSGVDALQAVVAQCIGLTEIRALSGGINSTIAAPIYGPNLMQYAVTIAAATSLRAAIAAIGASLTSGGQAYVGTIDFWRGLRFYPDISSAPDYSGLTISDSAPGEPIVHGVDGATVRAVTVTGTGVSVTVTDGTGKPGATVPVTNLGLTTAAACTFYGLAYLAQYATSVRGTITITDTDPATWGALAKFHVGGVSNITNSRLGIAGVSYKMTTIAKTFNGSGRENWVISYGGAGHPSAVALARHLTAATPN
jgi:hypothetical protein